MTGVLYDQMSVPKHEDGMIYAGKKSLFPAFCNLPSPYLCLQELPNVSQTTFKIEDGNSLSAIPSFHAN